MALNGVICSCLVTICMHMNVFVLHILGQSFAKDEGEAATSMGDCRGFREDPWWSL